MNPRDKYRSASAYGWSRIDMLLHVYDHAINSLRTGQQLLETGDQAALTTARLDAQRKILLIVDGLDLEQGDVPQRVLQLCVFALEQVTTDSAENWEAAARVLDTLRTAFLEIREDAQLAECEGRVPKLEAVAS